MERTRMAEEDVIARRNFLTGMGAALALAGGACTRAPREEIVPYVVQPPEVTPGRPRFYATASVLDGYATGVLVESHEGRPTKVEGNPAHPASLGAAGAFEQASVLSLYDPTRARSPLERGNVTTREHVEDMITHGDWTESQGRGLYILLEPTSSPTLAALVTEIHHRLPRAVVSFSSPATPLHAWEGARIAFGRVVEPRYDLSRADVIVSLDSDFLATGPAYLRLARQFADRRSVSSVEDTMNRLYVVEALQTVTGAMADHRLRVRASDVLAIAASLASALGLAELPGGVPSALTAPAALRRKWVEAVARDLAAHRGRSVVIAGDAQPPIVHALAHAMNAALGNLDATVTLGPSSIVDAGESSHHTDHLSSALGAGDVDTLVVCGTNAAYASPAARGLRAVFGRARQSLYLGLYVDETAALCTFVLPRAHPLESWGDARAFDGTRSVVQPLIAPMYGGATELDVLAALAGRRGASAYDLVRSRLEADLAPKEATGGGPELEKRWRRVLKGGVVGGIASPTTPVRLDWAGLARALGREAPQAATGLELVTRLDPRVHDGRFANDAWLLELPSPIEKLTWTNAATLSVETAQELGIRTGDEVELRSNGRVVSAPACIVPGQAEGTVGLTLGWGRSQGAELAQGRGANAYVLYEPSLPSTAVEIARTGKRLDMPFTQSHHELEGRDDDILHLATLAEYRTEPRFREAKKKRSLTLYDHRPPSTKNQWGMAIDLSRCTECSACVVACQAENNVPTVGADGVVMRRQMHWLRVDTYFVGDPNDPQIAPQPMLCQHCEKAPCEYVCPVNATVHSDDGLNEMVYNRCVGTRFCSNNCPYKVRRFNWFDYHRPETHTEQLVHNPDVTVRERGVMEKCTFCVQRIRENGIRAAGGEAVKPVQTACQQTCPTQAIVFGDLLDEHSDVGRMHHSDRAYAVLGELGTEPRVRYLARLRNPNGELT
jgi:molybdopterin-containing oxidoreductase family iron-sulfur binding subunit